MAACVAVAPHTTRCSRGTGSLGERRPASTPLGTMCARTCPDLARVSPFLSCAVLTLMSVKRKCPLSSTNLTPPNPAAPKNPRAEQWVLISEGPEAASTLSQSPLLLGPGRAVRLCLPSLSCVGVLCTPASQPCPGPLGPPISSWSFPHDAPGKTFPKTTYFISFAAQKYTERDA